MTGVTKSWTILNYRDKIERKFLGRTKQKIGQITGPKNIFYRLKFTIRVNFNWVTYCLPCSPFFLVFFVSSLSCFIPSAESPLLHFFVFPRKSCLFPTQLHSNPLRDFTFQHFTFRSLKKRLHFIFSSFTFVSRNCIACEFQKFQFFKRSHITKSVIQVEWIS